MGFAWGSWVQWATYYVDPMGFLGGKERIQIPINSKHSSLEALKILKRHTIEYTGLKPESEKHGLGSPIFKIKLC